jgi:surface protein
MTLENLLYNIGNTAIKNKVINYAAAGSSIFELNAETIVDYPLLFASPTGNHEVRVNTTDYEITLYYIDRLLRDSANDVQIFSTGVEQLKLIMRMIENIEGVVEVADTYSISNFAETEKMNDSVAGAFATVTITVLNTSECDDIQTIISFTKLQEKTVVIDENGEYEITYDSNYEGLKKVEVIVEVPDLNGDYDTGYDEGKAEGLTEGYDNGFTTGKTEGFEEGKAEGLTEGYDNGYQVGQTEGYTEGNIAGYQLGYNVGNSEGFVRGKAVGYDQGKFEGYEDGYQIGQTEGVEVYVEGLPTLTITENGTYNTVNKGVEVNITNELRLREFPTMRLGYSTFTTIPENINLNGLTNMDRMFTYCQQLTTIPEFDSSSVQNMNNCFSYCSQLTAIPLIDTSSVTNLYALFTGCSKLNYCPPLETSKCQKFGYMFSYCTSLTAIPQLNTSSATDMANMFVGSTNLTTIPALDCSSITGSSGTAWFGSSNLTKLTNLGGFINLKYSSTTTNGLVRVPNLTYESCINVLNGLYDFTANGETPNSSQGQLKVHANFLTTVGDDISIGLSKGWIITA